MNVAILGNGGRESAIAWAVSKSPLIKKLYILPGNGGTGKYGINSEINISKPFSELTEFCLTSGINLVIAGPESPLVDGVTDTLSAKGITVFGPSQKAARLEGSKAFLKKFLAKYKIPTADFKIFKNAVEAVNYVMNENKPFVVKTDGLAAGKGAIVNKDVESTINSIHRLMVDKEFGNAGETVILEEILKGTEVSVFIASDGDNFQWLASAQDHKRVFNNDEGPNTGGMGIFSGSFY